MVREDAMNRQFLLGIVLLIAMAFGVGYKVAPKERLDHSVQQSGFLQTDASKVISTTVESLRGENKLLVFSYRGTATAEVKRTKWIVFGGHQRLIIPAVVPYYLDLSELSLSDATYDEKSMILKVRLPKLKLGDIAFTPEQATTINGGLLTFDDDVVSELSRINYKKSREAITAQAQQPGFLRMAEKQAIDNVRDYFEIPLRITGNPNVKVLPSFR
jgi:hypothetical protein